MKRLSLILLLSSFAFGQGFVIQPKSVLSVVNGTTRPVANATITVCPANSSSIPCTPATVSIFKDIGLTQALSNPFTTDANGNYQFAVALGTYTVTETAAGFAGYSYQLTAGTGGTFSNPGVFTNTQMNEYLKSIVNGCNSGTEINANPFGFGNLTTAVTGCVATPSGGNTATSAVFGANVTTSVAEVGAYGGLFQSRIAATNGNSVGMAATAFDTAGSFTNLFLTGASAAVATANSGVYTTLDGMNATSFFSSQPAPGANFLGNGFVCRTANSNHWNQCLNSPDGTAAVGVQVGAITSVSGAANSQPVRFMSRTSGTTNTPFDIIAFDTTPSGTCTNTTLGLNAAAASASTVLYVCLAGTSTWTAITIP